MVTIECMSTSFQNSYDDNLMSSEMVGIGPLGESGSGWSLCTMIRSRGQSPYQRSLRKVLCLFLRVRLQTKDDQPVDRPSPDTESDSSLISDFSASTAMRNVLLLTMSCPVCGVLLAAWIQWTQSPPRPCVRPSHMSVTSLTHCAHSAVGDSATPWTVALGPLCPWTFPGKNTGGGC